MPDSTAPRRRRRRGDGSIYRDSAGRYRGTITVADPDTGRPVRRYFSGDTEAEVRRKVADAALARDRGELVRQGPTLEAWARRWLIATSARVRTSTLDNYRVALEYHALPRLGHLELARIRPSDVEHLLASMIAKGSAPSTAGLVRTVLGACLAAAMRDGLVARNAVRDARPTRAAATERRSLTPDELRRILDAAADDAELGPAVELLAATGLRRGELLGLSWDDYDVGAATLTVRRALTVDRTGVRLTEPKTGQSRRRIALPRRGVAALERRRATQSHDREEAGRDWADRAGLIFTSRIGTPVHPQVLYDHVRAIAAHAGVEGVSPHTFRHTVASAILAGGVPVKDAADALGHSPAVLMRTYAHALPGSRDRVAAVLDRALEESAS